MTTIAQAVANLTGNPRPVLFLDTCALLDIVRAPLRSLTPTVRAGLELRTLAGAGNIQLFVQDIVPREWTENLPSRRGKWGREAKGPFAPHGSRNPRGAQSGRQLSFLP